MGTSLGRNRRVLPIGCELQYLSIARRAHHRLPQTFETLGEFNSELRTQTKRSEFPPGLSAPEEILNLGFRV